MTKQPSVYLESMVFYAQKLVEAKLIFCLEDLEQDYWKASALARTIQELGELANEIPKDIRTNHPAVPWDKMIKMRHLLVHHYENASAEIMWSVVSNESEPLLKALQNVLKKQKELET